MAIPQVVLSIFDKPILGNAWMANFDAFNYRHRISAVGGFDSASCDIAIRSSNEGQRFLDQFIGNRVVFITDNPIEPCWEGFINRMTFSENGVQYSISLDEMANRVVVTHTDPAVSNTGAIITTAANNTQSQAIFGIKQENIDFGVMRASTGATALRDTVLAQRAWPKTSIERGVGNGLLHLEFLGFWHTLGWEHYTNSGTGSTNLGAIVLNLLATLANGTTFFDNADTTDVAANATAINSDHVKREAALDSLMRWREMGNAALYFVVGITRTLFQTGTRRLYYRAQNAAIEYTARQGDGLRIRDLNERLIRPWVVQPDRGVRVSDMLIGWNGLGDNPAETWIAGIDYDHNRQSVQFWGDDNTRAEGAFQLKRYGRPIGKKFSATVRRSV